MSFAAVRRDLLAGLTASFALVPESLAFALVARLNPLMGLYGAAIICAFTALCGGRPAMISGAAGSMAVVIVALVVQHGVAYFAATVVLSALLMLAFGLLRLGKLVRMIPHPVMLGFVNGLAIIIAAAQFEHFKLPGADGRLVWMQGSTLYLMGALVLATMLVVLWLPRLTRALPSALVAIIGMGLICYFGHVPTRTLGDISSIKGGWPSFQLPAVPWHLKTLKIIAPYAVLMALVGLLETLLTFNLTDEITHTAGQPNRECMALGGANLLAGLFGGMGGCAMIGQTMINLDAGGRGRLSGIVCGLMVMSYILLLSSLIEKIPLAALVGVMFVVAIKTFAWGSLRILHKVPLSDALVIAAVTIITVCTDLAIAVLCGVVIAALSFAWKHAAHLEVERHEAGEQTRYTARGTVFFASAQQFKEFFRPEADTAVVVIDGTHLRLADHSAVESVGDLCQRYKRQGKTLRFHGLDSRSRQVLVRAGQAPDGVA